MKATGIVRKIDELGRITIPKEIRRTHGIEEGDPIEIYAGENGEIILLKYISARNCIFCGNADATEFNGKRICNTCVKELNNKILER